MDIAKIQKLLQEAKLDGWLFTDFQGHDFITKEFLELGNRFCTRRLFYLIPSQGEPTKVLSAIEPLLLDHLPGEKMLYHGIEGQKKVLSAVDELPAQHGKIVAAKIVLLAIEHIEAAGRFLRQIALQARIAAGFRFFCHSLTS